MTANEIIKRTLAEVGVCEQPAGSNKVKYNTEYYGKEVQGSAYPWCATFVWWIFKGTGLLPIKTASCSALLNAFKKNGRVVSAPQPGDIVFFKFNKKSTALAEHVGIVVEVPANKIISVEGNTSVEGDKTGSQSNGGIVAKRNRSSCIVAFARPNYSDNSTKPVSTSDKDIDKIAREVIAGRWGYGVARKNALENAGYNYAVVQKRVNEMMKGI